MTPAARLSAAITVLDRILDGEPAEKALTNWGRANRFAGSGDRAALRDLVFDALRCKRSYAAFGGGVTGRGLILGQQRQRGVDLDALFTGIGHAPAVVQASETARVPQGAEALDCPDWLLPLMQDSLGAETEAVLRALQQRAPVFLRVNLAQGTVAQAQAQLAAEGIVTVLHPLAKTALEVTENARKIQNAAAYLDGLVELQDAASQAVVQALPLRDGMRVLDHCAGGGGKTLAMAAQAKVQVFAHDANPRRMADLPARATRAGAKVQITDNPEKAGSYDLILTDVPCSGSGSWRRDPMGKWALTPDTLAKTCTVQAQILDRVAPMVAIKGVLAYATCSLLRGENEDQIDAFLARTPGWHCTQTQRFSPVSGGDGFFIAILTRI